MREPPPRCWLLWAKHGFRQGDEVGPDHRGQLWPNPTSPRLKVQEPPNGQTNPDSPLPGDPRLATGLGTPSLAL